MNKMNVSKFLSKKVKTIEVTTSISISELPRKMAKTGFQGRKLAEITEIIERMIKM